MENEGFINMDHAVDRDTDREETRNEDDETKISKRQSRKKYSVKLKKATLELNELSKQSNFPFVESNESLIHLAVRNGRRSILKKEISKAKESNNIDNLDESGFAALHHTTRYNRLEAIEQLLKNGANVNVRSRDDHLTPLHIAARFGWFDACETLLKNGADASLQTTNGATVLHLACRRGNVEVTELLLQQPNVDINAKDKSLLTPLHIAASLGHEEISHMLINKGADVFLKAGADQATPLHLSLLNACTAYGKNSIAVHLIKRAFETTKTDQFITETNDMDGYHMLHVAAYSNGLEVIKMALDQFSVDVDLPNPKNGKTALHVACTAGMIKMVELLVQRGAKLNSKDSSGQTPLHYAAEMGHKEVIEFLIDEGANVDERDYTNRTPFLLVASSGKPNIDAVKSLIAKGADINANEAHMKNCLHLAVEAGNVQLIEFFLQEVFPKSGWGIFSSPDVEEKVPLHYAAICDNLQVLQLLLKVQTRLNFQDEDQQTALFLAVKNDRPEHVEALGRAGASLFERDGNGQTALHVAAANGSKKVCKIILSFGADVNSKDSHDQTPLICAASQGCVKTTKTLLDRKANIDDATDLGDTALLTAIRNHNSTVVELLLDRNVNVTHRDFSGLGVMETAVKWDAKECVDVICSHKRWKEILGATANEFSMGNRPMQLLIQFFPEAAKTVMNNCITRPVSGNPLRQDYTIQYDFQFLDPGPDDPDFVKGNRYFGPLTMVKYKRQDLLLHPLTQMLLNIKWSSFGSYTYYLSFLLYLCYILSYSYFLVTEREHERFTFARNFTYSEWSNVFEAEGSSYNIAFTVLIFVTFQLLKEIVQIFVQRLQYFKQPENLLEWMLYSTSFVFLVPYIAPEVVVRSIYGRLNNPAYLWATAVISALFSYVNFVLFLRRFSLFGLYITMFLVVLRSLFKVMLVFMQFILAFSVVFYILFIEQPSFSSFPRAIVKTTTMTIGEVDFTSTFVDSVGEYTTTTELPLNPFPQMGYLFCALFVYAMCITLMNLLIGIAIGDIDHVQRSAELKRLAMQVDFVAQVEEKYPRFITRWLYKPTVEIKPNKTSLMWRFREKIIKGFQGGSIDVSSNTEDKYSIDQCQTVDLNNMAATLERNRKQIKSLVTAMEAQTAMMTAIASKLDTDVKPDEVRPLRLRAFREDWSIETSN